MLRFPTPALVVAACVLLGALLGAGTAAAQNEFDGPGLISARVRAVASYQGMIVLGGEIRVPPTAQLMWGSLVAWDASGWHGLGEIERGMVDCLAVDQGDLIVGGWLHRIDGVDVWNVARYDGSHWHAMGAGIPHGTSALALFGTQLYAGVPSARNVGEAQQLLWRWDGQQWTGIPIPPDITWGAVHSLLEFGGRLWVGGWFLPQGAGPFEGLGVLCWDGAQWSVPGDGLRSSAENPDPYRPRGVQGVHALAILGNSLVAGGSIYDPARGIDGLAVWDGTAWSRLPSHGVVSGLVAYQGMVVPLGSLVKQMPGGYDQEVLAGWDGTDWTPLRDARQGDVPAPHGFITGSTLGNRLVLVAGGNLESDSGGMDYEATSAGRALLEYDGQTWTAPNAGLGALGAVRDLATWQGRLVVGGEFFGLGREPFSYVTSWDGHQWIPLARGLGDVPVCPGASDVDTQSGVASLRVIDGHLYALGHFSIEGQGVEQQDIACWDGQRWQALGAGLTRECGASPPLRISLAADAVMFGSDLVVAGYFDRAGGLAVNGLASWDGSQWNAHPPGPEVIPGTEVDLGWAGLLNVHEGSLYGMRGVTFDGTYVIPQAIRWNGSAWEEFLPASTRVSWIGEVRGNLLISTIEPGTGVRRMQRWVGDHLEDYPYPGVQLAARVAVDGPSGVFLVGETLWRWNGQRLEVIQENWNRYQTILQEYDGKLWMGSEFALPGQWGLTYIKLPVGVPALQLSLRATSSADGVELHWSMSPPPSPGTLTALRVQRRAGSGGAWSDVASAGAASPLAEGSCLDPSKATAPRVYRAVATVAGSDLTSAEVMVFPSPPASADRLLAVSPNPFNPTTTVRLQLRQAGRAHLDVVGVDGRLVRHLDLGELAAGEHRVRWDGRDDSGATVASGVYSLHLRTPRGEDSREAALIK